MTEQSVREKYKEVIWTGKPRNFLGLPLNFTRFIVTNTKIITTHGLFNIKEDEIELYRITDKRMEFPLSQRIFGCGTVVLHCKDTDSPIKTLKSIKEPRKVAELLEVKITELRSKFNIQQREMYGAIANSDTDTCDFN